MLEHLKTPYQDTKKSPIKNLSQMYEVKNRRIEALIEVTATHDKDDATRTEMAGTFSSDEEGNMIQPKDLTPTFTQRATPRRMTPEKPEQKKARYESLK